MTAGLYAPTLGYGMVYEDRNDLETFYRPMVWRDMINKPARSLTVASFALTHAVTVQPWAAHAGNVALHLLNIVLVYAVARAVLPSAAALMAAALFALHPLQVEAVAYVSSRSDLVATAGVLLALLATSAGSLAGALCGVVLALLGKESAIVAWGLVPLWAAWTRAAFPIRRWLVMGLVGGAVLLPWFWPYVQTITLNSGLAGAQLAAIWRLLALLVWPFGFTIDHDWRAIAWLGPVAFILSAGLTAWALVDVWRTRSWLACAWLWTLVAVLPRLVVPLDEGLHERHLMIPVIGWCLGAGYWLSQNARRGSAWQAEHTI